MITLDLFPKKEHSDWQDFVALQNQFFAENPKEFETFEFKRNNDLPQERDFG